MRLLGQGEAKTLGCLPGILRHVQGPPTTRRRLATGDPGDTSLRAARPVSESTAVSNPQHWVNRRSWRSFRAARMPCHQIAMHKSCRVLSIRAANADMFKVGPRLICDLCGRLTMRARDQSHPDAVASDPMDAIRRFLHHTR